MANEVTLTCLTWKNGNRWASFCPELLLTCNADSREVSDGLLRELIQAELRRNPVSLKEISRAYITTLTVEETA